jgi:hypothetical protein
MHQAADCAEHRRISTDPRPPLAFVREFGAKRAVVTQLADASAEGSDPAIGQLLTCGKRRIRVHYAFI